MPVSRDDVSADKLRSMYLDGGLSGPQIAEEFDVSSRTVYNWMDKFGIERREKPWGGEVEVECECCGEVMERWPKDARRHEYFVCGSECRSEVEKRRNSGDGNPNWRGGPVGVSCEMCGGTTEILRTHLDRDEHHFCSPSCNAKWYAEERGRWKGEDNPMYGRRFAGHDLYYGPNWNGQREQALDRDGHECVLCGSVGTLCVHHKKPIATFDRTADGWWGEVNDLDNLITLCRSCHQKVHMNPGTYLFDWSHLSEHS